MSTSTLLRLGARRAYSTTPTQKAASAAKSALATSQAFASSASQKALAFAGPVGERITTLVPSLKPRLLLISALAKHVYRAEQLAPPTSLHLFQNALAELTALARQAYISRGRTLSVRAGVIALEAWGIYKVGEIIGRRNLVGYNLH